MKIIIKTKNVDLTADSQNLIEKKFYGLKKFINIAKENRLQIIFPSPFVQPIDNTLQCMYDWLKREFRLSSDEIWRFIVEVYATKGSTIDALNFQIGKRYKSKKCFHLRNQSSFDVKLFPQHPKQLIFNSLI